MGKVIKFPTPKWAKQPRPTENWIYEQHLRHQEAARKAKEEADEIIRKLLSGEWEPY